MAEDDVALDEVLKFADVSRPMIFLQHGQHFLRKRAGLAVELAVVVFEEVAAQIFDVAAAFAQRGHAYVHDVDAVVKILAEGAGFNLGLEVAIGGTDYADFDFPVFLGADTAELAILKSCKSFDCRDGSARKSRRETRFRDAAIPTRPGFVLKGAGEGPLLVAEELALQQGSRDRGAVHFHVWPNLPWRQRMDEAGNDVLPGAAFARDQDGNIGGSHFAKPRTHRLHDLGVAEDDLVRGNLAERLRQRTYGK